MAVQDFALSWSGSISLSCGEGRGGPANRTDSVADVYCSWASVGEPGVGGWVSGGQKLAGLAYFAETSEAARAKLSTYYSMTTIE